MHDTLKVTGYTVRVPANLPPHETVRLVMLCDLHDKGYRFSPAALVKKINALRPDLIVSAGDLVTASEGHARFRNALRLVRYLAAHYPFYLTDGNHETRMQVLPESYGDAYETYMRVLSECGAHILHNDTAVCTVKGLRIALTGYVQSLRDYNRLHPARPDSDEIIKSVGRSLSGCYRILLAHNPSNFKAYAGWGADLTLSGHLHGGMIRLPLIGGVLSDSFLPFPKYDRGLFSLGDSNMIVSCGLGTHTLPVRWWNPAELVSVDLV